MIHPYKLKKKWPTKTLGEVAEFLDGKRKPVKESDRKPGIYPYYGANGQQGTIDDYIFDEPLILIAEDGGHFRQPERGIAYKATGKFWVNNHAHVLKPKNKNECDLDFLMYQLKNYDITPFISGSTRDKLTKGAAEKIPVVLPPIDEQYEIVNTLNKIKNIQDLRDTSLMDVDKYLSSIFLEQFGDPVKNPMGWEKRSLKTLVQEFRYGTSAKAEGGPLPVLRIPNITGDEFNLTSLKYVTLNAEEERRIRLEKGDVLFVRTNGNQEYIGRSNVFDLDGTYVYASYLIRARLDQSRINPHFLVNQLRIQSMRSVVMSKTSTTAGQFNINTEGLGAIEVIVPDLDKQNIFVDGLNKIKNLKKEMNRCRGDIEEMYKSTLQEIFLEV